MRSMLILMLVACAAEPRPLPTTSASSSQTSFTVTVTGSGRPIIFIPGLSSSGSVWAATVDHLGGRYQSHVVTLAGFAENGGRPIAAPFLPTVRRELAGYIRAQKLDHPVLVGHSLGGFLALWLAATEPDLVGAAMVIEGAPYLAAMMDPGVTVDAMRPRATEMRDSLAASTPELFAAQTRAALTQMITTPADVERVAAIAVHSSLRAVADAVYEMMTTDLRRDVAEIHAPVTLIIAGHASEAAFRAQVGSIPHITVVVAEQARHFVMLDDPSLVNHQLDQLLGASP